MALLRNCGCNEHIFLHFAHRASSIASRWTIALTIKRQIVTFQIKFIKVERNKSNLLCLILGLANDFILGNGFRLADISRGQFYTTILTLIKYQSLAYPAYKDLIRIQPSNN